MILGNKSGLYIFFFLIFFSLYETLYLSILPEFLNIKNINIKWLCYLLVSILFLINFFKIGLKGILQQKYILFYTIFLISYSTFNLLNNYELLDLYFNHIKILFGLPTGYQINIYLISKYFKIISVTLSFCLLFYYINRVTFLEFKKCIFAFYAIIILSCLIIQIYFYINILPEINTINQLSIFSDSINRDTAVFKFVGKKLSIENGALVFDNAIHLRLIGIFKEPSTLAFFSSIIFFLKFENLFKNRLFIYFYFFLSVCSAYLFIGTVSLKHAIFYLLVFFVIFFRYKNYLRRDFYFIILPFLFVIFIDLLFSTGFVYSFISKAIYYAIVIYSKIFNIDFNTLIITKNFLAEQELLDKLGNIAKKDIPILPENFLNKIDYFGESGLLERIIGNSFLAKNWSEFYQLFIGNSMIFYHYFLGGVFSILIFYQLAINLLINNLEVKFKNFYKVFDLETIAFIILIIFYYLLTKDQLSLDIIVIQCFLIIISTDNNENKLFKKIK